MTKADELSAQIKQQVNAIDANLSELQTVVKDWKPKQTRLQQNRQLIFNHWTSRLRSIEFEPANNMLARIQRKIINARSFIDHGINAHPQVKNARQVIFGLATKANTLETINWVLNAVVYALIVATIFAILFILYLIVQFLAVQIPLIFTSIVEYFKNYFHLP